MRILVAVKRVIDYNVRVRVKSDQSGVDLNGVKMGMNPFCEIAVEEAVRLKEKGIATHVSLVSFGIGETQEQLRQGLAFGADEAWLYTTDEELLPLSVARALVRVCEQQKPDCVILGKQSIDSDNNQVGQMLAGLLNWPQATFVSQIDIDTSRTLTATREVDQGLERLQMPLPAVVTTDLRLNEPRFLALPNIIQAKNKPLHIHTFEELDIDKAHGVQVTRVMPPKERQAGVQVDSVTMLVDKLRNEAGVLS